MAEQLENIVGEYRGEVLVYADFILGADVKLPIKNVKMKGYVIIREYPYPGYERRILSDGRTQIDLEMVESYISGRTSFFEQNVEITETTEARNMGTLTQIYPGVDFPAAFELKRRVIADTHFGKLQNEEPIIIRAILDSVPPVAKSRRLDGINVFHTASPAPVPLLNTDGEVAAYFHSTAEFAAGGCSVLMTSAS